MSLCFFVWKSPLIFPRARAVGFAEDPKSSTKQTQSNDAKFHPTSMLDTRNWLKIHKVTIIQSPQPISPSPARPKERALEHHQQTEQDQTIMNFITLYSIVVTAILAMLLVPPSQQIIRHYAVQNIMPLRANHVVQFFLAGPRTQMLHAVVEANVFEYIDTHGPASVSSIASALELNKDTLHTYLSNLAFMELIQAYQNKNGDEIVSLTNVSKAHLLKSSKINMVPLLRIMASPYASTATALNAAHRLRTGNLPEGTEHAASPQHEFWKVFASVSNDMAVESAQDLIMVFTKKKAIILAGGEVKDSRALSIIDTACSSGGYGSEFATILPNARVTFFDFDYVVEITQKEVTKNYNHILPRSEFVGGDLFKFDHEKYGNMYDIALAPQIFHHFSYDENVQLATTYFKALKPGGWLGVVEMLRSHDHIPNHPYDFAEFPVLFNLVMKMTTLTGQAFTETAMVEILETAGFEDVEVVSMFPKPYAILVARKAN